MGCLWACGRIDGSTRRIGKDTHFKIKLLPGSQHCFKSVTNGSGHGYAGIKTQHNLKVTRGSAV